MEGGRTEWNEEGRNGAGQDEMEWGRTKWNGEGVMERRRTKWNGQGPFRTGIKLSKF